MSGTRGSEIVQPEPSSATSARKPEPASSPAYLTLHEVAALLRISTRTIERWIIADPSLPVLRVGRTVRFPRERFLRWIERHEQGQVRHRIGRQMPSRRNSASGQEVAA